MIVDNGSKTEHVEDMLSRHRKTMIPKSLLYNNTNKDMIQGYIK